MSIIEFPSDKKPVDVLIDEVLNSYVFIRDRINDAMQCINADSSCEGSYVLGQLSVWIDNFQTKFREWKEAEEDDV